MFGPQFNGNKEGKREEGRREWKKEREVGEAGTRWSDRLS